MTSTTPGAQRPRVWYGSLARWVNPATRTGAVAVLLALVVLLVPGIGVRLAVVGLGLALGYSGLRDLGRVARRATGPGATPAALLALRGIGSLVVGVLLLARPGRATVSLLLLGGVALLVRAAVQLLSAALTQGNRAARAVAGLVSLALGVLTLVAPRAVGNGLVAVGALGALLVGALLVVYGARAARTDTPDYDPSLTTIVEIMLAWVRDVDLGPERRAEIGVQLFLEPPGRAGKHVAFWTMLVLSVAIATLAVLQDSTAVVIGAMLVAPLMTPILGLAASLVNGWATRVTQSLLLVTGGAGAAVVLAMALSSWLPSVVAFDANQQITSRISPNLLDLLIAVAAGAAGAFATVSVRVSASIAGVAIAVALVPPLAVVGISLTAGRPSAAAGAALLFLTNFVAIVLAAVAVFLLAGFAEPRALADRGGRLGRTLLPFIALALVVTVPLLFTSEGLLAVNDRQVRAETAVAAWLGDAELVAERVSVDGELVEVRLSGSGTLPDVQDLRAELVATFGPDVVVRTVLTPAQVEQVGP